MQIWPINVNWAFMSNDPKHIWMCKTEIMVVDVYEISIYISSYLQIIFLKVS